MAILRDSLVESLKTCGASPVRLHFDAKKLPNEQALMDCLGGWSPTFERSQASHAARSGAPTRTMAVSGGQSARPPYRVYWDLGVVVVPLDHEGAKSMAGEAWVRSIGLPPRQSLIRPLDSVDAAAPTSTVAWGLQRLRIPELWERGLTGKGVRIGHLDTGVDPDHPALAGAISKFSELDSLGDPVPNAAMRDSSNHGTHTAGTMVGRPVGGRSFGVAPAARLVSAMCVDGDNVEGDAGERLYGGMEWALRKRARVVNLSAGIVEYWEDFEDIVAILRSRNILPVVAVGNEGPNTSRSPGNYPNVLSVGFFDRNDGVHPHSSSDRVEERHNALVPDLVAPGDRILSCVPHGKFRRMTGSSMATPHVSGLAALLFEARPDATAREVEAAIINSCGRADGMSKERANHGIPDAVKALNALVGPHFSAGPPYRPTGPA